MAEKGIEITARAESVSANAEAVNQFPTQLFLLNNANHELSMRSPWKIKTDYGYVLTFAQEDEPTAEHVGDLWFASSSGNTLYRWNGSSWEDVSIASTPSTRKLIAEESWQDMLLDTTSPFEIKPWNRDLIAMLADPIKTGTATSVYGFQLVDSGANFGAVPVPVGSIVRNTSTGLTARVLPNVGTTAMWLDRNIFTAVADYKVYAPPALPAQFIELIGARLDGTGGRTADTDTTNHLTDADGTVWTGLVSVNDWAWNLNTGRAAQITAVAAHDLTLTWDAFPNGNEVYLIFSDTITISDAESPLNGRKVYEMGVSGRYLGARLSAGNVEEDVMQTHGHFALTRQYFGVGDNRTGLRADGSKDNGTTILGPSALSSGAGGVPRVSDHTQPRTLSQTYIMRIK